MICIALLHSWASQTFVAVRTTYEVIKERMAESIAAPATVTALVPGQVQAAVIG